MSVLDDILSFLRDLVTSITQASDNRRTLRDSDVPVVKGFWRAALETLELGLAAPLPPQAVDALRELVVAVGAAGDTVDGLEGALSLWVASQLDPIFAATLIERPASTGVAGPATAEVEQLIFERMAAQARNGAAVATSLVLVLNMAAAALDAGAQVLSLGQIKGAQQLIQNVIWATGLADVGGLAFRPQVAASMAPLLERHYNSLAQAQIPGSGDLIRFLVREVFDPERREQLEAENTPELLREFMRQRGFSRFWTDSYWAAHWNLPSTTQLNEMVHRGTISTAEWERQVRLNDFVPEGVPWLNDIIYSPYTRVDIRRMEGLGVLSDQQMLTAYADIGYFAPRLQTGDRRAQFASEVNETFDASIHKAEAQVIFAKLTNAIPTLRRRVANGFLRPEQVEGELAAIGLTPDIARRISETIVKAVDVGEAEAVRQLTTAQIVRGAKNGLISFEQGQFLLEELGWPTARAEFMLRLQLAPEDAPTPTQLGERLISRE